MTHQTPNETIAATDAKTGQKNRCHMDENAFSGVLHDWEQHRADAQSGLLSGDSNVVEVICSGKGKPSGNEWPAGPLRAHSLGGSVHEKSSWQSDSGIETVAPDFCS